MVPSLVTCFDRYVFIRHSCLTSYDLEIFHVVGISLYRSRLTRLCAPPKKEK